MKFAATAFVLILSVIFVPASNAGAPVGKVIRAVIDKAQSPFKFQVRMYPGDPEPEAIDVFGPSGKKVQTIPTDAVAPCDTCDLLEFNDLNFDGYNDLLILTGWGSGGSMYDVWLYSPQRGLFRNVSFDNTFANPDVDEKNKVVISSVSSGCCNGHKYHYRYINGKFSLFKEERYFMENDNDVSVVRELVNGKWRVTGRGTSVLTGKAGVGDGEGEVRVEFVKYGEPMHSLIGEILVSRASDSSLIQSLFVDVYRPSEGPLRFEFMDLTDDGYQDLIFYHSRTGDADAAPAGEVYLWVPMLRKFVRSNTLSQAGEIAKAKEKGCVQVRTKCSSAAWGNAKFCFKQETGRWKQVGAEPCPEPGN